MEDFNSYSKSQEGKEENNLFEKVFKTAKQYDGKSKEELFRAVYEEAKKGKMAGTLSNGELDNFAKTLSPFLDDKKRKYLDKIISELKKI